MLVGMAHLILAGRIFLFLSDGDGGIVNVTSTHLPQINDWSHSAESV